jgi:hypothetical protein
MNPLSENTTQAVALIKFFSEEEHFLAFKKGFTIFRTPHYYRTLDSIGRGDRNESCLGFWNKGQGDKLPKILSNGTPMDLQNAQSVLIYPIQEQHDSWLQSWCIVGPHNNFESSLESMLEEFGTYFVVMPAVKVNAYVKLVSAASGLSVRYGPVRYSSNPFDRSLTTKDSTYSYQKELRFYLGECDKTEIQDMQIQLDGLDSILFEAASLKLASPSGEIRYCSLGRKEVVNG